MLKNYFPLVFSFFILSNIYSQTTAIPDVNFEQALIDLGIDSDMTINGSVLNADISEIISLSVNYKSISDLTGIEGFINLRHLFCKVNLLTSLDVSQNTKLEELHCNGNLLTSLDLSQNTALANLRCNANSLTSLDLSQNTALTHLDCNGNSLTSLDISQNTNLELLYCSSNLLTSLDLSQNTALANLHCYENSLTSLDVSQNTVLTHLYCYRNSLTSLDLSQNTALTQLLCSENPLTSLDVSQNTALTHLDCRDNSLTSLDLSQNTALANLVCDANSLTSLDVSQNTSLFQIICTENSLASLDVSKNTNLGYLYCYRNSLTSLDLGQNTALKNLNCLENSLTSLDLSQNTGLQTLDCRDNSLTSLDLSQNTSLSQLRCNGNSLTSLNAKNSNNSILRVFQAYNNPSLQCIDVDNEIEANAGTGPYSGWIKDDSAIYSEDCFPKTYVPDVNFEQALIDLGIDSDITINGSVLTSDVSEIISLDVNSKFIGDLTGIEDFVRLKNLYCQNNELTDLDISKNLDLISLDCSENNLLESLNVKSGNNSVLTSFDALNNPLLSCINVDNEIEANAGTGSYSGWNKDDSATYSEDCFPKTYVPDDDFEQHLICLGYDDVLDDYVLTANIINVEELNINNASSPCDEDDFVYLTYRDLTGIEDFKALKKLSLSETGPIFDLSGNLNLEEIYFYAVHSGNLDLDFSKNIALKIISISNSIFESINLSENVNLIGVSLDFMNNLTNVNIKNENNYNLISFSIFNCLEISCIQVDDVDYSNANWTVYSSPLAFFSEDCASVLGMNDEFLAQGLSLYPNPVSNILTIDSEIPLVKVEVYSMLGKRVKVIISDFKTIPTNDLSNGVYIAKIHSENGLVTKKLIKN